jgi:hypothetical protein
MHIDDFKALREKELITQDQFQVLEPIISRQILSVFYELRIILYLGVMLFTTGVGILIYKNIGDLGHLLSIIVLFILTAVCFYYAFTKANPYSHEKTKPPTPFFDYIVLLGCLLFISVLSYLQFQYSLFDEGMGTTTLVTAAFFFYSAYRFDHLGILSLAIAALASFWSISVSPQKWYSGDFLDSENLYLTAIFFGAALCLVAILIDKRKIKQHFTFTYLNFGSLVYLIGCLSGIFINDNNYGIYMMALFAGCAAISYYAHLNKSFLFILYAFVFSYIGITFLLADIILDEPFIWFFYLLASCGGFIFFIIRFKSYFKRAS